MLILKKYNYYLLAVAFVVILFLIFILSGRKTLAPHDLGTKSPSEEIQTPAKTAEIKTPEIIFVGPRGNLPADAPSDYGFWSFAIPVPGVLSRSGQPTLSGFQWMKNNGWKSDINLRVDGDHAPEVSDDALIPGFKELGLNYLKIQMLDGAAPTDAQAEQFLSFVAKPENQPAHVHCRGGIGRAGVMVALYRYAVQGWPVDQVLEEAKLFQGGVSIAQEKFLKNYAANHAPGNYGK
ncbi:MAG: sulfur transferase domain-containing protein [Parcubacteria group bacterium]